MNRVLALKPSCTRLQTGVATKDKDGPEATANLAPVETAEPVTEAVLHEDRDPSSPKYINLISLRRNCFSLMHVQFCESSMLLGKECTFLVSLIINNRISVENLFKLVNSLF